MRKKGEEGGATGGGEQRVGGPDAGGAGRRPEGGPRSRQRSQLGEEQRQRAVWDFFKATDIIS